MLEFILLMIVLDILLKIPVGQAKTPAPPHNNYDNGTAAAYIKNNSWEFKSVDDCFDFRELRKTGWRGNAEDFYKLKEEEEQWNK